MWISKAKYNKMKSEVEKNEHDADMYHKLIKSLEEKKTVFYDDFILMSRDVYDSLSDKLHSEEDNAKNLEAELEWYKVKYHELKMSEG